MWDLEDAASPTSFPTPPKQTNNLNFRADELCELVLVMALDTVQLAQAQPAGFWTPRRAEK